MSWDPKPTDIETGKRFLRNLKKKRKKKEKKKKKKRKKEEKNQVITE